MMLTELQMTVLLKENFRFLQPGRRYREHGTASMASYVNRKTNGTKHHTSGHSRWRLKRLARSKLFEEYSSCPMPAEIVRILSTQPSSLQEDFDEWLTSKLPQVLEEAQIVAMVDG